MCAHVYMCVHAYEYHVNYGTFTIVLCGLEIDIHNNIEIPWSTYNIIVSILCLNK